MYGAVNGRIVSEKGTLIIGERAVVEAEIQVGTAVIKGTVNGHVVAADRIDVSAPAKINGDIQAPVISIETGVVFNGKCSMVKAGPADSTPPPTDAAAVEKKPS